MGNKFTNTLFTQDVKKIQSEKGSRGIYQRGEDGPDQQHVLSKTEIAFIKTRDSFYLSTAGSDQWPYIQHRGGPVGFVSVLNDKKIAFPDFTGNRQYISVGNLSNNKKVALFFMDYPNQARLKMIGTASIITRLDDPQLVDQLNIPGYSAKVEHAIAIDLVAFDWNCPQHITPRWTEAEIREAMLPLNQKIIELEAELAKLKRPLTD